MRDKDYKDTRDERWWRETFNHYNNSITVAFNVMWDENVVCECLASSCLSAYNITVHFHDPLETETKMKDKRDAYSLSIAFCCQLFRLLNQQKDYSKEIFFLLLLRFAVAVVAAVVVEIIVPTMAMTMTMTATSLK